MIQFPVTPAEELVLPGEDIAAFDELRAGLHAEHCAATATELFLVEELVQNVWRVRRFRAFEVANLQMPAPEIASLALIQRSLATAERSCHRALAALSKLQLARGFVPAKSVQSVESKQEIPPKTGSVTEALTFAVAQEFGLDEIEFERMRSIREKVHAGAANSLASFRQNPQSDRQRD